MKDANGNIERVILAEAKGGKGHVNPLSKGWHKGRRIAVGGETVYALQGTKEYVRDVARVMSENTTDANLERAGRAVRRFVDIDEWAKVDYYVVSTTWKGKGVRGIGRRGLAHGVSRVVRVWQALF